MFKVIKNLTISNTYIDLYHFINRNMRIFLINKMGYKVIFLILEIFKNYFSFDLYKNKMKVTK